MGAFNETAKILYFLCISLLIFNDFIRTGRQGEEVFILIM